MKESRKQSNQLELFAVASLDGDFASHSALPGSKEAKKMTVTSGQKWYALLKSSNPVSSLVKMFLGSSKWASTKRFLTWKVSVTPQQRLVFRLVPSMPRTLGKEYSLWPTPNAGMTKNLNYNSELCRRRAEKHQNDLVMDMNIKTDGGQLNPAFCEYLMGFPPGWTDLNV